MYLGTMAERYPDRDAVVIGNGDVVVSYAELDARSNQVAHALRDLGVGVGDCVAVMLENCEQFFEVWWAAMRAGLFVTPVNWHLTPVELEYIIRDADARVLFFSGRLADVVRPALGANTDVVRVAVGPTELERALDYDELVGNQPTTRLVPEVAGSIMFYSSGTTGRPKGIRRGLSGGSPDDGTSRMNFVIDRFKLPPGCRYLSPGPLYHSAPSLWCTALHTIGSTAVVMPRFDAAGALELIDRQRVTHSQWVPTMFQRMLRLPEETRSRHDLSTHVVAWHAAAPCPVDVKRKMIEWWGPILLEYYAGSEGGGTIINSEEWLARPGSVGRHYTADKIFVLDLETKTEVATGHEGAIYFKPQPNAGFEYHNDPSQTADAYHEGLFTIGDVGYLDDEGYLFLTDRASNMIIAGGVNIYPREIEDAILLHPAVADVAVLGIPDDDFGEKVLAVIELRQHVDPSDDLAADIQQHCRERLAGYKTPRVIEFIPALPRDENGKLYKRLLRDPHWEGRSSRLV